MAYELIGVEAFGKFDKTIFGIDPTVEPEMVDPLVKGSLLSKLVDSSVLKGTVDSSLFSLVRPVGLKNLSNDVGVIDKLKSTGKGIESLLSSTLNNAPKGVNKFGNLFDDGSISFGEVDGMIGRLSDSLPTSSFNSITQESFNDIMAIGKEVTTSLNGNGNYYNKLLGTSSQNNALGINLKGTDSGILAGFVGGTALNLAKGVSDIDIMDTIGKLSEHVKLSDDNAIGSMKKSLSRRLAKAGSFMPLNDLMESVGITNFNAPQREGIASDLINNFKIGEHVDESNLSGHADEVYQFLDVTKPNWLQQDLGAKEDVYRIDTLNASSTDFKRMAVTNERTSLAASLSLSSFI